MGAYRSLLDWRGDETRCVMLPLMVSVLGAVHCGTDMACFEKAATTCASARWATQPLGANGKAVLHLRTVGPKNGKCEVQLFYEPVEIIVDDATATLAIGHHPSDVELRDLKRKMAVLSTYYGQCSMASSELVDQLHRFQKAPTLVNFLACQRRALSQEELEAMTNDPIQDPVAKGTPSATGEPRRPGDLQAGATCGKKPSIVKGCTLSTCSNGGRILECLDSKKKKHRCEIGGDFSTDPDCAIQCLVSGGVPDIVCQ
jgi:hypothetical protein